MGARADSADEEIQLYADDTVISAHGCTKQQAAYRLTNAISHLTVWLNQSRLKLNVTKTISMLFSVRPCTTSGPDLLISGQKLHVVSEFKNVDA